MTALRFSVGRLVTSRSLKKRRPAVGLSRPAMMRRRVLLPQPLGPRRKKSSPAASVRSILSSARVWLKRLVMEERRREVMGRAFYIENRESATFGPHPGLLPAYRAREKMHRVADFYLGAGAVDVRVAGPVVEVRKSARP